MHLPRIGHSTKGFNWYGTERLIRKHLASRGIPTFMYLFLVPVFCRWNVKKKRSDISQKLFIWQSFSLDDSIDRYYHGRTAKNTALPQTTISAASTSSPRPQLHNSDRLTDETEAETPGPSAPLQSPGPAGLPSFMRGVRVFFYNLLASERKRLARYLITYPVRFGGVNPIIVLLNHSYHLLWDISGYAVPVKACIFKSFKRCCLNTINHPTIGTF